MNMNIRSDRRWWLLALLVVGASLAGWFVFQHWYRDSFHDNIDPQVMARLLWIVGSCTCVGIGIAMIAGARHDYVPMSGSLWSFSAAGLGALVAVWGRCHSEYGDWPNDTSILAAASFLLTAGAGYGLWSLSRDQHRRAIAELALVDRMIATAHGEVIDDGEPG